MYRELGVCVLNVGFGVSAWTKGLNLTIIQKQCEKELSYYMNIPCDKTFRMVSWPSYLEFKHWHTFDKL